MSKITLNQCQLVGMYGGQVKYLVALQKIILWASGKHDSR